MFLLIHPSHHHHWDNSNDPTGNDPTGDGYRQKVYLLEDILKDVTCGHNVVSTVYAQAYSFHRKLEGGAREMNPLGELEVCGT